MKTVVVAGIGTGIGKTIASAIITEALEADYWKPVQAGDLENSDTQTVKNLVSASGSFFHPEAIRLTQPMSPHAAAKLDKLEMDLNMFSIPVTGNRLVIELAGGLMVPLNDKEVNIDLIKKWGSPVILISQNYLGSINHTLLSLEILKSNNIPVLGILFNGAPNKSSEKFILEYSNVNYLGHIPELKTLNKQEIKKTADTLRSKLNTVFR